MRGIRVSVIRLVDTDQPGWVECRLVDAAGLEHLFVEKGPIVSSVDLWTDTAYPQPGIVACTVVEEHAGDPPVVTVDTEAPWGIASKDGMTRFDILRRDLVDF